MKRFLLAIIAMISMQVVQAQQRNKTEFYYNSDGTIQAVAFSPVDKSVEIPLSADMFFETILKKGKNDSYRRSTRVKYEKGHERFEQYYSGIRVDGGSYTFHYDKDGIMSYVNGRYIAIEQLDTIPSITKEKARDAYAKYKGIDLENVIDYTSDLMIITNKTIKKPTLVYKVYLTTSNRSNDEYGYVDAHTEEVIYIHSSISCVSATGWFETKYNGFQTAQTDYLNNTYRLYDGSRAAEIHTKDMYGHMLHMDAEEVTDNNNYWYQYELSNNKGMALDVHWALQKIYDRLYIYHSKNSFDNNGKSILAYTNDLIGFSEDNACWNIAGKYLQFGASTNGYPYSTLDIVAHEFGHGINDYQIGWGDDERYLDEGLSDIWGAIMDYRYGNSNTDPWRFGEQRFPSQSSYNCIRNLAVPDTTKAETQMFDTYVVSSFNNSNDIYEKSGIFSHWFYLLVNGGQGQNDLGNSYEVTGVGMDVAENLIVDAVYQGALDGTISYLQVRNAFITLASQMNVSGLVPSVTNAWYAVGVGDRYMAIEGPDLICDEGVYVVDGLPSGCTVEWSLSDSYYNDYCMEMDTPSTNQCTITKDDYDSMVNATLTATIKDQGVTIRTLTKTGLSAYNDIIGHYTSGNISSDISYTHILPVMPGYNTIILSPVLKGATVSYSPTATIPLYWGFSPYSGEIDVTMPYNSGSTPIVFNIYDTCGNYYNLYLYSQSQYLINISIDGNEITVLLNDNGESTRDLSLDEPWSIEIRNATTGELMATRASTTRSTTITTAGWPKGMYIVKVIVGNETWSEKIVKK